jgi:hypothetical protein
MRAVRRHDTWTAFERCTRLWTQEIGGGQTVADPGLDG